MPEFFDISLISRKTSTSKSEVFTCLNALGLYEGENSSSLFPGKQIIVSCFEDEESDFDEISIGIAEQRFTREKFDSELKPITNLVNQCFQCNPNLEHALCSYELNSYFIGEAKKLRDFSDEFLKRFPIVYKREDPLELAYLETNLDAQEIFAIN